eukprot:TRINITY_DN30986_c0_g2_i1.p1 TRINITY_DN30986_c0_g2~~TRINITY_DN30986_c0_g2_i1.p1  ORF type:complete len:287 (-),score=21.33 TRINITY_DN30986_c0_g2_i1:978-1838(-)
MFAANVFPNATIGWNHCRLYCIAQISCQYWSYSSTGGCWVEDVSHFQVPYPLTTNHKWMNTDSEFARSVVAGEYIQHYCGGDPQSAAALISTTAAPLVTKRPPPSVSTASSCVDYTSEAFCMANSDALVCNWDVALQECLAQGEDPDAPLAGWAWILVAVVAVGIMATLVIAMVVRLQRKPARKPGKPKTSGGADRGFPLEDDAGRTDVEDTAPLLSYAGTGDAAPPSPWTSALPEMQPRYQSPQPSGMGASPGAPSLNFFPNARPAGFQALPQDPPAYSMGYTAY